MTIVPAEKIQHDPQTLLYHFPSMHPVRYQKLSREFTFWSLVKTAETVAKMSGKLLVPRDCIHWQRKQLFSENRIVIHRKVFFVLDERVMTKTELEKYHQTLSRGDDFGASSDQTGRRQNLQSQA